jgi:hypothetical protein
MPSKHARVGASGLHRTIPCPGSVYLCETMLEKEDGSFFSAEGTVAHHVRESCLMFGFEPEEFLGDTIHEDGFDITVDDEMIEALAPGISWVRERDGEIVNEMQVTAGDEMPGQFGTLDVGGVSDDLIVINDLKYGAGVPVSAVDNVQLMAYALWFWENYARHHTDATDFLLVIDQPRAVGGGGEWAVTLDELLQFKEVLRESFDTIFLPEDRISENSDDWEVNPNAPLNAGEKQCKFCPVKGSCAELARHNLEVMSLKFDDLEESIDVLGDVEHLTVADADKFTPAHRVVVALNAALIKKWVDDCSARVLADGLASLPTPGAKVVKGRATAKTWIDPAAAEWFIMENTAPSKWDQIFAAPKMISPTQAEALVPKAKHDDMEDLWVQGTGGPSLVPIGHHKPAYNMADKFED